MFADRPRQEIGSLRVLLIGAFIIIVPIVLITTTIRVAISEKAVYDYAVQNYGAERVSGIPEAELLRANQELRDYLAQPGAGPLAPQVTTNAGETKSLFNARETAHMADVRSLVQFMFTVQLIAAAAVITLIVAIAALFPIRVLAAAGLYGSLLTVAVLGLAGMGAMAGFDAFWDQFHVVAFANDLWQLNPARDHLIQMYPETFWQDAVTALGGLITIQALALGIVSGLYLVLSRPRENVAPPPEPRALPDREHQSRRRLSPPNPRHYVR